MLNKCFLSCLLVMIFEINALEIMKLEYHYNHGGEKLSYAFEDLNYLGLITSNKCSGGYGTQMREILSPLRVHVESQGLSCLEIENDSIAIVVDLILDDGSFKKTLLKMNAEDINGDYYVLLPDGDGQKIRVLSLEDYNIALDLNDRRLMLDTGNSRLLSMRNELTLEKNSDKSFTQEDLEALNVLDDALNNAQEIMRDLEGLVEFEENAIRSISSDDSNDFKEEHLLTEEKVEKKCLIM